MATTIKLKNSVTTTNAPSSLAQGEVAINVTDKKVWVGNAATTPVQLLGDGGSASFTSVAFADGSAASPSITNTGDTNTGIFFPAADTIAFSEGGTEAMRLDSSGNLGLGVTPSAWGTGTAFQGNGGNLWFRGVASGVSLNFNYAFYSSANRYVENGYASRYNLSESGQHQWFIAPSGTTGGLVTFTQAMTLDASGRLLVGTTSSRGNYFNSAATNNPRMQLEGTSFYTSAFGMVNNEANTNPSTIILGKSRGTSVGSVTIVASGDNLGGINFQGSDGTDLVEAASIIGQVDGTPGANDMPGRLVFLTTADGASSPTERVRITSDGYVRLAGSGIQFNGDTAAANALDDYEEGTFTPTIVGTTTAGTGTYSSQLGRYTKIGDTVFVQIWINMTAHTGTGNMTIAGLPFTTLTTSGIYPAANFGRVSNLTLPANSILTGYSEFNSTGIVLQSRTTAGGNTTDAALALDTAFTMAVSITYKAA